MTTMQIDRAVVEQALEALEEIADEVFSPYDNKLGDAILALRAALAQQAEPLNLSDPAVQKRLATQWGYVPAAQAEPVEPVYKVKVTSRWHDTEPLAPAFSLPDGEHLLYTAPPQRTMVPLTEGEIVEAVREADLDWQAGWTLDEHAPNRFDALARAIEKASWEKNHG